MRTDQEMMVLEKVVCYSPKRQGHTLQEGPPGEEPGSLRDGDREGQGQEPSYGFQGKGSARQGEPV